MTLKTKPKKGTMLQGNAREPCRCGTGPCGLFLVFYSCLLFQDLAGFLCSFPLAYSEDSSLYNAFRAPVEKSPLLEETEECRPAGSGTPAALGNSEVLGLKIL